MSKQAAYIIGALLLTIFYFTGFNFDNLFGGAEDDPAVEAPAAVTPNDSRNIQLALILDTSNSMDGLIEQAKSQLWKMANRLASARKNGEAPFIEIALYEYGNSNLSVESAYIRQLSPFTDDMDKISEQLFSLTTEGGEEYCGKAMQKAMIDLPWSRDRQDLKIMVIAGNEPFSQGPVPYQGICKVLYRKGILLNTIHCGSYEKGQYTGWEDAAQMTSGQYLNINMDKQVAHVSTPYDKEVLRLNQQLNTTYIGYGAKAKVYRNRQLVQDSAAAGYGTANLRERALFKSKAAYSNTAWDLVDASNENGHFIEQIELSELPEQMQSMSIAERNDYIAEQAQKRQQIQEQIQELNGKVDQYIQKQALSADGETIDQVLINAVSQQAKAKGFVFE
ncbi:MAG: VWA domain-containing protein [Bacteroidota bacterium]